MKTYPNTPEGQRQMKADAEKFTHGERCIECGAKITKVRVPAEISQISGSLICDNCAKAMGLPTNLSDLFGGDE